MLRKKTPDPRSLPESWSVLQGTHDGRAMFARVNAGLRSGAGHPNYGIRLGVAVPLKAPTPEGLPRSDEFGQLNAVEDELVRLAGDRAILVGVITTAGMREFVLYTGDGEWIPQLHKDLQVRIDHHEVQVMAQRDEEWATYNALAAAAGETKRKS